ncbi:acylphosphatase [Rhodopseudomonas julia]|uniref:acylphosphatase n=1 Tax=Rhodopseudomonas julia TaxID=200617 RepID=A0ABU0CAF0_9BRAD|nr:acylphosphatase [Rhodopseudomonas julia]MDQ0327182.1 acylphosphatase [Rhodopseudomonas julia]
MAEKTVRVVITGRVQGVSYRAWTKGRANDLDLSGWVANRSDGAVEAVFTGSVDQVDAMLAALRSGPALASVDAVQVIGEEEPQSGPFRVEYLDR